MAHPSGSPADRFARIWQNKGLSDWLPSGWGRQGQTMQEELFRQAYVPEQYKILNKTVEELDKRWGNYHTSQQKFKESQEAFARRQEHFAEQQKVWGAQLDEYLNKPQLIDVGGGQQVEQSELGSHIQGMKDTWANQEAIDLANFKSQAAGSVPNQTQGVQWRKAPTAKSRAFRRSGAGSAAAMKISGVNV